MYKLHYPAKNRLNEIIFAIKYKYKISGHNQKFEPPGN